MLDTPAIAPVQPTPNPPQTKLSEPDKGRLGAIIQNMEAAKEPEENIRAVVSRFQQKYGQPQGPLPGEGSYQYQPDQPAQQFSDVTNQYGQFMQNVRGQHGENAVQNMATQAMHNEIRYKVGQEMQQYAKPSSTSVKRPASAAEMQFPDIQSDTDQSSTRFPGVVQPIVDKYMDPETGYAAAVKLNEANDPTGATTRTIIHQIQQDNPAIAKKIQAASYVLDAQNRPDQASRILDNARSIESGDLQYDVRNGQLQKQQGFWPSLSQGFEKRNQDLDDARVYMNGSRQEILNKLEGAYADHDPDEPVGVPSGGWGKMGATIGDQGPVTITGLLAGAMGTVGGGMVGNPELGPVLAAAVTTPEFMARSYKNTIESAFKNERQKGASPDQALDVAQGVATRNAALEGGQAAAMSVMGAKLGFGETPEGSPSFTTTSPSYLNAATKVLKKIPAFAKDVATESGVMGGVGAAIQGLKNINEGKPTDEGVGDAFWGTAGFTAVMAGVAKGLGGAINTAKDFNALRRGAAKAPQPVVDASLADLLTSGQITPEEAAKARLLVRDQKAADVALPELDEATQQKVQQLIETRDKQQKLMDDPSMEKYKHEFKASIDDLNEQIETLKTKPKPDELIQKAKDIIAQHDIPGVAGDIINDAADDPEMLRGHLKEIAEQSYDPATADATKKAYNGLVAIAQEMHPIESLPHVENMHSLQIEEPAAESHEPVSPDIQLDKSFRTIDYGDYADGVVPETPMARASIARDIENGDVKIGDTGETFNEFKPRIIEPFKKVLDTEDPNTAIVTSSSVLKGLKVWDDMGRPDINNLTPEQNKDFADRYNDETVDPGEMVSFDKAQGDPSQGQIHVIRHGETDANEMGIFRTDDSKLTQHGVNEAKFAGAKLKDILDGAPVPKIISSDLPRTVHTSNEVYKVANGLEIDPRAVQVNDEVHPNLGHEALQGSYDRLLEGGADPKDPDMVRLKDQIQDLKNQSDAIPKQTANALDVRQQTQNGQTMGVGNAEHQESASTGGPTSEQRPDADNAASTAGQSEAADKEKTSAFAAPRIKATIEQAPNPVTGIRNAITEQRIEEMGLEPFEQQAAREWGPIWQRAKDKMNNGYDIQSLINRKEKNPGEGLTDEDAALLTVHQVRKEAEYENAMKDIVRARKEGNMKELDEARISMASVRDQLQQLYDVTKETGREAARGFNARKMLSDRRYTLANMILEKMAAKDGEELSPEEEENIRQQYEDIKAKNDAYEKRIAQLEEENKELRAKQTVDQNKKDQPNEKKSHDDYVKERQQILDDIREKLRKSRGEAGATLVPYAKELTAIAPDVLKLVKSLVEEGIDKLPDLIDHVHGVLSDSIPGITKKDARDLIAGEYNKEGRDLTPNERKLRDLKMQASLINKLEDLKAGEEKAAGKESVKYSPEVEDLRKQIIEFQKGQKQPRSGLSEESRLKAYKTRVKNQIDDLQKRIDKQNFSATPNAKPLALDEEAQNLKANLERAKDSYQQALKKDMLKNRSWSQILLDGFVKVERAEKLSSPITMGKLMVAAVTRMGMTPIEEGVGAAVSAALPQSFKQKALGEVDFNSKALAKGYRKAVTDGMKDAYMNLQNKRSNIDAIMGKTSDVPPSVIEYMGQLHAATKAPVKRFAFEKSLQKRLDNAIKYNVPVSDPVVMSSILNSAYKDAQRAIFMQDNAVSDFWTNKFTKVNQGGKYATLGNIRSAAFKWLIPFVKIPTNIIGEVGSYSGGHVYAAAKLAYIAMDKGLKNMTDEEAESVLRNFKKGIVGTGALLLGYYNADSFGGFYQQGKTKKEDEPGWMGAKIFGLNIPAWMMESPIFQTMQLGATARKLADTYVKKDKATQGIWTGSGQALLGLADEDPLIQQPEQIYKAISDKKDRAYYLGELAKSSISPALFQNIATWTDPADKRSLTDELAKSEYLRKPTTIGQHIEMGIPVLRENVPLKKGIKKQIPSEE